VYETWPAASEIAEGTPAVGAFAPAAVNVTVEPYTGDEN